MTTELNQTYLEAYWKKILDHYHFLVFFDGYTEIMEPDLHEAVRMAYTRQTGKMVPKID